MENSDLEDMRASQQITETEAEELTQRSRSMMDINMKLQITAAKAQNKTIDLELRRLEADQAMEQLSIVQVTMPNAIFLDGDANYPSCSCPRPSTQNATLSWLSSGSSVSRLKPIWCKPLSKSVSMVNWVRPRPARMIQLWPPAICATS